MGARHRQAPTREPGSRGGTAARAVPRIAGCSGTKRARWRGPFEPAIARPTHERSGSLDSAAPIRGSEPPDTGYLGLCGRVWPARLGRGTRVILGARIDWPVYSKVESS